ncbi:uncharacterized protein PFL1_03896 [Pseudozyma flocculosa PF-1]|uniref:Zn(2)-C6 fungal-type domain-containing protein n=2 Tax=Pseudozyma flocculosa TaxID=84751 RepID=A0A5C3EWA9_9BASI|nr:uncharacterized protein PFL1_03896 [Pseudozyma flocculosa PF-1]EPQ28593.1 hypothetical protein PFL1_03896 [Pseudozyma flocculosa PF-1]SPO36533.1 uncharacterized protein PSFLO_02004 [Pseudozyma flocculosa]
MSRLPHAPFSSSWDASRSFHHSTYASAGPSTYAQPHQPSWSSPSVASSSSSSRAPLSHNTSGAKDLDQPMPTPTTVITADGTTVYAATGRKRKRLQKACVACHKAKRRCDGGLPCSNCDFSGRTCCYSDANGKMVLPTARAGPNANGNANSPLSGSSSIAPSAAPRPPHPSESLGACMISAPPSHVHAESRPHPAAALRSPYASNVVHDTEAASSTMPRGSSQAHAQAQAPPPSAAPASKSSSESPKMALSHFGSLSAASASSLPDVPPERRRELISIFFAQLHPFSSVIDEISFLRDLSTSEVSPALLFSMYALAARFQQDVEEQHRFAAGETYARAARAMLTEEDANGCSALEQPSLENATALCLLAAHEAGMGRLQRALSYSSASVRMVIALRFHEGAIPEARHMTYSRDSFSGNVRRNSCQRLVCVAWALDILIASLVGQAPSVRADEIDACIANFRASNSDDVTKAFFSLTQIFAVFVRALDHARATRSAAAENAKGASDAARQCEESLHAWAEQLGPDERFDEANLNSTAKALAEIDSSPSAAKAGCWAMMHMVAESLMFVLHSAAPVDEDQSRKTAAYSNLLLILDAFGAAGRQGLFALPALLICTEYPTRPKLSVSRWWNQARECWGLGEVQIADAAAALRISRQSAPVASSLPYGEPLSHQRSGSGEVQGQRQPLPRHHASASGSMLPSLGSLPLPGLRLSPPTSNGARSEAGERPSLSPIGAISSPTDLPSWRTGNSQGRGSPASTEQDGGRSPTQANSFELYASNAMRSPPPGSTMRSGALGASSDPRSAWSPITSLRGEKRTISNVSQ